MVREGSKMSPDWSAEARALTPPGGDVELTWSLDALSRWSEVDRWISSGPASERAERVAEVRETLRLAMADLHSGRVDAAAVVVGTEGRPSVFFSSRGMSSPGENPWAVLAYMLEVLPRGSSQDA